MMRAFQTLHSILVIFQSGRTTILVKSTKLYIPFWLYSNIASSIFAKSDNCFTFHSGYIPIIYRIVIIFKISSLYIPFWLYSNPFSYQVGYYFNHLYIPFWLYSNLYTVKSQPNFFDTLYIPFWLYSNSDEKDEHANIAFFTFHSGYIPMDVDGYNISSGMSLHSILVIFQ